MSANDRRRHMRVPRLLKLSFVWEGLPEIGVTTDISLGGAFINTTVFPPHGSLLELHLASDQGPDIVFEGIINRAIDPLSRISVVPGVGVRWRQATTTGTTAHLARVFSTVFDVDITTDTLPDGRSLWTPEYGANAHSTQRLSTVRQDLDAIESVRPDVNASAPVNRYGKVEHRVTHRYDSGAQVTFYVNRLPMNGVVRDISLRGLWVEGNGGIPRIGDVVTCRYPLPDQDGLRWARLVGVVVRAKAGDDQGFAVEIIRIDNLGAEGAFEKHIDDLDACSQGQGVPHIVRPPEPALEPQSHAKVIRLHGS